MSCVDIRDRKLGQNAKLGCFDREATHATCVCGGGEFFCGMPFNNKLPEQEIPHLAFLM